MPAVLFLGTFLQAVPAGIFNLDMGCAHIEKRLCRRRMQMGMFRIWTRRLVRGPLIGTNSKDCSPKDEGYLATMPWLKQFIPLNARTSDPSNKEGGGISIVLTEHLFTDHKNYMVDECCLVTRKGKILRSVSRPHINLHCGIYHALLSLGGAADEARFAVTVKNFIGNLTLIRLYKFPKRGAVLSWQKLMRAHRTPEQIAADEDHAERGRVRQAAVKEARAILQDA